MLLQTGILILATILTTLDGDAGPMIQPVG
jgi:hypothetical protein